MANSSPRSRSSPRDSCFEANFNNRAEEAIGSALDSGPPSAKRRFGSGVRPWLGYLFLLEDCCRGSLSRRRQRAPFKVSEEFRNSSTPGATSYSAAAWCSIGTTIRRLFLSESVMPALKATTRAG